MSEITGLKLAHAEPQLLREQVRSVLVLNYNKDIVVVTGQGRLGIGTGYETQLYKFCLLVRE